MRGTGSKNVSTTANAMLSISEAIKGVSDAVLYYMKEGKEAYYLAGIGQVGRWVGRAVEALQLPEKVEAEAFRNLLNGYSPDGQQPLVQNAGHPDRNAGWDLTFSVPKPVSVLWAMSPASVRGEIEAAQRHAVEVTLRYAEEIWGFTRRGQGGKIHEHAALLFATFEEYVSRAQDMQIHMHCVLIDTTVRQDGTTGALHSINFFRAKMLLGAMHEAELAKQLRERLNVGIEPQTVGFGIAGVPEPVCRHFSQRRTEIEKVMDERKLSGAIAAKVVTRETRPRKQHLPPARLFPHWHDQGRSQGWGPEQAAQLLQQRHAVATQPLAPALRVRMTAIPPEQQTRKCLVNLARTTALEHGANGREFLESLDRLRLPDGQSVLWLPRPSQRSERPGQTREYQSQSKDRNAEGKAQTAPSHSQPANKLHASPTEAASGRQEKQRTPGEAKSAATEAHATGPKQSSHTTGTIAAKTARDQNAPQASLPPSPGRPMSQGQTTQEHQRSEESNSGQNQTQREQPAGDAEKGQAGDKARSQAAHGRTKPPHKPSPEQRQRNLNFERAFGVAVDRIFPEKQTRERLTRLAGKLAQRHRADDETLDRTLSTMRPGAEWSFLHVETPRLFPKSPISPIKWLRAPKLALGDKPNKWGDIRWKKDLVIGELRIQQRRLFPRADRWSPLHKLALPALHFSLKKSKWEQRKQSQKHAEDNVQQKPTAGRSEPGKDKRPDHSQSQ